MPAMRSTGAEYSIVVDFTAKKLHTRNSGSAIRWANDLRRSHGDGSVKIIRSEGSQSAFPVQKNFTVDKPATEGQCSLVECVLRTRGFVLIACQGATPSQVVAAELRIRQSPRRLPSSEVCFAALDWAGPKGEIRAGKTGRPQSIEGRGLGKISGRSTQCKMDLPPSLPPQINLSVRPADGKVVVVEEEEEDAAGGTDCALYFRQELGGISPHTISPYISWHCWHWPQFSTIVDSASGRGLDPAVRLSSPLGYKHSAADLLPTAPPPALSGSSQRLDPTQNLKGNLSKLDSANMPAASHGDTTPSGISDPMSQKHRSLTVSSNQHQLDPPSFISGAIGEDTNQLVLNQGKQLRILACAGSHLHLFRPHYFISPAFQNRQFDRCAKFSTQFRLLIGRRDPPLGPLSRALKYGALGTEQKRANCLASGVFPPSIHLPSSSSTVVMAGVNCARTFAFGCFSKS
ncbi:hypothetical protein BO85DRAFT_462556 [Aspergillus piperis CBS 112811]|uniref:Uncharacterized protein n=1 Tax=Aspergillus piperis CBS 112811 TaxID=1448313 RepID=A0A8G1QWI7_9EURO|nr:hypothetical protein BO85DRAFT_462556 [Aspergillus piperis CBS 112811]RAH53894.1 hypothetical protein BO85DRAFT_462556 [Aspergillus piperis CBS 112811]